MRKRILNLVPLIVTVLEMIQNHQNVERSLWKERQASLNAGLLGGLAATIAILITTGIANLISENGSISWMSDDFKTVLLLLSSLSHWQHVAIALISGFLFGITYRYAVRSDHNSQLTRGVVTAFGLVRGLAQLEGIGQTTSLASLALLLGSSLMMFAIAQLAVDLGIRQGWIGTVSSTGEIEGWGRSLQLNPILMQNFQNDGSHLPICQILVAPYITNNRILQAFVKQAPLSMLS